MRNAFIIASIYGQKGAAARTTPSGPAQPYLLHVVLQAQSCNVCIAGLGTAAPLLLQTIFYLPSSREPYNRH